MPWFSDDSSEAQAHAEVTSGEHKADFSHELLAAAASYEAAKQYEKHVAANGKPDSHAEAKELIATFAGAFIEREVETKGLDFIDKEKAKHAAKKSAESALADSGEFPQ